MADSFDALFLILAGSAFEAGERQSCLNECNKVATVQSPLMWNTICSHSWDSNVLVLKTTILRGTALGYIFYIPSELADWAFMADKYNIWAT